MKKRLTLFILALSIVLLPAFSFARAIPSPSGDFYVYDETGTLDKDTEKYIINISEQLEDVTGAQVVVALVNSLEGAEIEEYSAELFRTWQIGHKDKDNGILLLIDLESRELRIEVGYGLEGIIPDSKAGEIINSYIVPNFKDGEYAKGVKDGFTVIVDNIAKEYKISLDELDDVEDLTLNDYLKIVTIMLVLILFILAALIDDSDGGSGSHSSGSSFSRGSFHSSGGSSRRFGGGGSCGGGGASGRW